MIHKFFRKLPKRNGKSRDSSNMNEVVRSVLNFLFFFTKIFHKHKKAQNRLQRTKIKNTYKKHLTGKKLLIRLFGFCAFTWLCFYAFNVFSAFSALNSFCAFFCV